MERTDLFLEIKSVLKLPAYLDQPTSFRIVLRFVDLAYGFLQAEQGLFQLSVSFWIITNRGLATKIVEKQWVFTDPLDWLRTSLVSSLNCWQSCDLP